MFQVKILQSNQDSIEFKINDWIRSIQVNQDYLIKIVDVSYHPCFEQPNSSQAMIKYIRMEKKAPHDQLRISSMDPFKEDDIIPDDKLKYV